MRQDQQAASWEKRHGMTLIELLVVMSILGLLSVTVLPAFSNGESARAGRRAAAAVSSLVAQSQATALGRAPAAGLWIEPLSAVAAIDLSIAQRPEPYRGDTFTAAVSLTPPASPTDPVQLTFSRGGADVAQMSALQSALSAPGAGPRPLVSDGDLIQIGHGADLFMLERDTRSTSNGYQARLRPEAGQTPANTLWPTPSAAGRSTTWHSFTIHRKPAPMGALQSLGHGMAIDLAWSGVGTERFGPAPLAGDDGYTPLAGYNPGQALAMMFDSAGAVAEVVFLNTALSGAGAEASVPVHGPILLLVGRIDRCGLPYNPAPTEDSPGANWQYADSIWIAIEPLSGVCKTAACDAKAVATTLASGTLSDPTTISQALRDSQNYIRSELVLGNR